MVDPGHPLYGLRLPLIGVTNKQYVGKACVVWLQPGIERIVPFAATSLAETPPERPVARLSLTAVRRLVRVLASLPELRPEDADATHRASPDAPALGHPAEPAADSAAWAAPAPGPGLGDVRGGGADARPAGLAPGPEGGD